VVISNVAGAGGLARAEKAGIATRVIDHRGFAGREPFDAALTEAIEQSGAGLVCLAGFMRLLTDGFCNRWRDRMINIHPSLLPAFKGLHTHERVLAAGVRITGCTVHFVRAAMDDGPIIAQAAVPVGSGDTAETLAARVLEQEHRVYPLAVRLIAEGRVTVRGDRAEIKDAAPPTGALISPP
jgi:phosphoribosylglycinamide formyltransferase-1